MSEALSELLISSFISLKPRQHSIVFHNVLVIFFIFRRTYEFEVGVIKIKITVKPLSMSVLQYSTKILPIHPAHKVFKNSFCFGLLRSQAIISDQNGAFKAGSTERAFRMEERGGGLFSPDPVQNRVNNDTQLVHP